MINISTFKELILTYPYEEQYENLFLNFDFEIKSYNLKSIYKLNFKNCKFKSIKISSILQSDLGISFINCFFTEEVNIVENEIKDLNFIWHETEIQYITSKKITISDNKFHGRLEVAKLLLHEGNFSFIGNVFLKQPAEIIPKRETGHDVCVIRDSNLSNPSFNNNTYYMPFTFFNNVLKYDENYSGHYFNNNVFQKAEFINTDFGSNCTFVWCDFLGTALFNKTSNINNSDILFSSCKFTSYTHFGEAELSLLNIEYCTFQKSASFQKAVFKEINLSEVKFEKGAYFDDIEVSKIKESGYFKNLSIDKLQDWKHTLRLIKQELQKSDNKIDYNRFRVYEFNAYREELKKESKDLKLRLPLMKRLFAKDNYYAKLKRDLFVLKLSYIVSDYGTDWKRALKFTLLLGFTLYIPFFVLENYTKDWDLNNWQVFPIGFLRFFILTDFYSPLKDGRTYIDMDDWNHIFSWLFFILGKIVIAFGIYEMIQAFRKFKA